MNILSVLKGFFYWLTKPLVKLLAGMINPNFLTASAILPGLLTAYLIGTAQFFAASITWVITICIDAIDGQIARKNGKQSLWGGLLDSFFDRLTDSFFFLGIMIYFVLIAPHRNFIESNLLAAIIALIYFSSIFSSLISYVRAKGEEVLVRCDVGFLRREVRTVLQLFTLIAAWLVPTYEQACLLIGISIILGLALITNIQRLHYCKKHFAKDPP